MMKPTSGNFETDSILSSLLNGRLEKITDNNKVRGYDVSFFPRREEKPSLSLFVLNKEFKKEPDIEPGESLCKREFDTWNVGDLDDERSTGGTSNSSGALGLLQQLLLSSEKIPSQSTSGERPANKILKLEPGESIYQSVKPEPEEILLSDDEQSVIEIDDEENSVDSECVRGINIPSNFKNIEGSLINANDVQESRNRQTSGATTASGQENNQRQSKEFSITNTNSSLFSQNVGNKTRNSVAQTELPIITVYPRKKIQKANYTAAPMIAGMQKHTMGSHQCQTSEATTTPSQKNNKVQSAERYLTSINSNLVAQNVGNARDNSVARAELPVITVFPRKQIQKANNTAIPMITEMQERATVNNPISNSIYSRLGGYGQTIPKSTISVISGIPFAMEDRASFLQDPINLQPFRKTCKQCGDSVFLDLNHFVDHLRHHSYSKMYCFVCQKGVCSPYYAEHHAEIHHKNYVECKECFRFFPNAEILKTHKLDHKGRPPFRCEHCPKKIFRTFLAIKKHIKKCHETIFKCNKCGSDFRNKKRFEKHPCSAENVHECPTCSNIFQSQTDLENHLKSHLEYVRLIYTCKICNTLFNSYNDLIVHRARHILEYDHSLVSFACQICKKELKSVNVLRKHVKRHSRKNYHCSVCQIGFTRQRHVIRHLDIHGNNYRRCHQCFYFYKDKRELRYHERKHRMGPPFYCEHCPKEKFLSFKLLRKHVHNNHVTLTCGICNKKFKQRYQLTMHGHTHIKKYSCKHCGKKFGRQDYLNKHMTIHKKSRAFKCPVCKNKFSRSDNFKVHIKKMHRSDKTYECLCGMKFEHRLLYSMHQAYHRGLVLYCDICNESFKKYSDLKKHVKIEHLKFTKYTCDVCNENFLSREKLFSHYDKKHLSISSVCEVCGMKFDSYSKLKDHKDGHETETQIKIPKKENASKRIRIKPSSYNCYHCGKVFNAMRNLKHHILTEHFNAENYECNLCGDGFLNVKSLNNHYHKHHRDENVICDICGSHFTKYGDFIKHKNKHEKDKVHECDKCHRSFLTAAELKRHRLNTHQKVA